MIDYEKKIREYLNSSEVDQLYKSMLNNLFPELAESNDEKIRKGLLKYLKDICKNTSTPFSLDNAKLWIAWLEKQGEREHQYKSRPRYVGEEELLGTNKQKFPFLKQELIDKGFAFTQDGGLAYPIHKIEKQGEQKPAEWSEEDDQYLLVCKNALAKYQVSDKWDASIISQWLENRLKSHHSQKQWRPSKEQLNHLERVLRYYDEVNPSTTEVKKLLEQLKAL